MSAAATTAAVAPGPFADALRRWRATRRVSQLELALRAGTTQRHVSYIEQGRSQPGRTMVVRLAESLELTLRERNALLLTAGFAPAYAESGIDDAALAPVRDALEQILTGHLPYPAVVARPDGELVAANAAMDVMAEGAAPELLAAPVNVLRLALHPQGMAPRVGNLAEWGRHILESLRRRVERHPDPAVEALLDELSSYVPPLAPGADHVGFAVPLRLRSADGGLSLITTLTAFATATDVTLAELHLEAFLPADAQSARILAARATRPPSAALPAALVVGRNEVQA